jgi:antirestriction protein
MSIKPYTEVSPAVYVGTYAKYNSGSIKGAWIKLEGHTPETFHAACLELHSDESDPELMFQDFEGFPRAFYSESALSSSLWEWIDCNDAEQAIWEAFTECFGYSFEETTLSQALDAYVGDYNSTEHFAEEYASEHEDLNAIPLDLTACIDWQAVWNSALRFDFCEHNGCFFYSNH